MRPPLHTARLTIRPFVTDDAERLYELDRDPEVMRYIGPAAFDSVAGYLERMETVHFLHYEQHVALGVWAVEQRDTTEFLGWVCLRPAQEYRFAAEAGFTAADAELGYRLKRSSWGQGVATEASLAVVQRGWEQEPISRVVAAALRDNRASIRVLEKCGLRRYDEFPIPGHESPLVVLALPRS